MHHPVAEPARRAPLALAMMLTACAAAPRATPAATPTTLQRAPLAGVRFPTPNAAPEYPQSPAAERACTGGLALTWMPTRFEADWGNVAIGAGTSPTRVWSYNGRRHEVSAMRLDASYRVDDTRTLSAPSGWPHPFVLSDTCSDGRAFMTLPSGETAPHTTVVPQLDDASEPALTQDASTAPRRSSFAPPLALYDLLCASHGSYVGIFHDRTSGHAGEPVVLVRYAPNEPPRAYPLLASRTVSDARALWTPSGRLLVLATDSYAPGLTLTRLDTNTGERSDRVLVQTPTSRPAIAALPGVTGVAYTNERWAVEYIPLDAEGTPLGAPRVILPPAPAPPYEETIDSRSSYHRSAAVRSMIAYGGVFLLGVDQTDARPIAQSRMRAHVLAVTPDGRVVARVSLPSRENALGPTLAITREGVLGVYAEDTGEMVPTGEPRRAFHRSFMLRCDENMPREYTPDAVE